MKPFDIHLLPHQVEDAAFLASRKIAGCFNGMGSGKTLTSLEAVRRVEADRVVIIGPPISLRMWAEVAVAWLNTPEVILKTGTTPLSWQHGIAICSYQIATKRAAELAEWAKIGGGKSVLICDESHALKSTTAKRTKAILGRGGLVNAFDHAWFLTGTPVIRHNDDLIPFLFRAAPGPIKEKIGALDLNRFLRRYTVRQLKKFPGARFPKKVVVGSTNTEELGEILGSVATRRSLADVWDAMPPLNLSRVLVRPQVDLLGDFAGMTVHEITKRLGTDDETLSKARRLLGRATVQPALNEVIFDRLEEGHSIVIGAWHTEVIDALRDEIAEQCAVGVIDGRTPQRVRDMVEADWNAGELRCVIGQIGAMGVSLNLQRGGNRIVVVEEDWSPELMKQFYARLHRMGQEKAVFVETIAPEHKLAQAIHNIANRKAANNDKLERTHKEALGQ